jgi:hypothetical protein
VTVPETVAAWAKMAREKNAAISKADLIDLMLFRFGFRGFLPFFTMKP